MYPDEPEPFDPLDYENIARSVVAALLEQEPGPLPPPARFSGAGVYAIYYHGDFPAYAVPGRDPPTDPIYVGKAIPAGARKGADADRPATGLDLFRRLCEHASSINAAENLAPDDFTCRCLVVLPVWVPLAERFLISRYTPIWNTVIDGFGNHDPGRGRSGMKRPRWDIVHPGRPWAARLDPAETAEEILDELDRQQRGLDVTGQLPFD